MDLDEGRAQELDLAATTTAGLALEAGVEGGEGLLDVALRAVGAVAPGVGLVLPGLAGTVDDALAMDVDILGAVDV